MPFLSRSFRGHRLVLPSFPWDQQVPSSEHSLSAASTFSPQPPWWRASSLSASRPRSSRIRPARAPLLTLITYRQAVVQTQSHWGIVLQRMSPGDKVQATVATRVTSCVLLMQTSRGPPWKELRFC